MLEELDHLESAVTHTEGEPSGTLRVVASSALSLLTLTPLIDGFRKLYPKVNVRLTLAERHVDLVEDGYDVGIVTAFMVSSTALVECSIGVNALVPVATPAFIAEHGLPAAPVNLQNMPTVGLPSEMRSSSCHMKHKHGTSEQVAFHACVLGQQRVDGAPRDLARHGLFDSAGGYRLGRHQCGRKARSCACCPSIRSKTQK